MDDGIQEVLYIFHSCRCFGETFNLLISTGIASQIVDKTIMEADKDKDGKISFDEFTKMVENTDVSMSMTLGKSYPAVLTYDTLCATILLLSRSPTGHKANSTTQTNSRFGVYIRVLSMHTISYAFQLFYLYGLWRLCRSHRPYIAAKESLRNDPFSAQSYHTLLTPAASARSFTTSSSRPNLLIRLQRPTIQPT